MKGEIKAQWIDLQQNGEERTGKLKIEITQSELQGENRKRKMNKTSQGHAECNKSPNIWIITVLEERINNGKTIQSNSG